MRQGGGPIEFREEVERGPGDVERSQVESYGFNCNDDGST